MVEILSLMRSLQPLERIAEKLRNYLAQDATNRQEWIEIQMGICLTLVEARNQFTAHVEFGWWCDDNGFGNDTINHQTRSAAIAMGREPEVLRKCLEETGRRSLETIYRFDFSRFTNVRKTEKQSRPRHKIAAPQTEAARMVVRSLLEKNEGVPRLKIAAELGVSEMAVQRAICMERGRLEGLQEADVIPSSSGVSPKRQKRIDPPYMKHWETITDEERGIPGPEDMAARHAHVEKYGKVQLYTKNAKDLMNDQVWIEGFILSLTNMTSDKQPEPEQFFSCVERLLAHIRQPNGRGGEELDFAKAGREALRLLDAKLDKGIERLQRLKSLRLASILEPGGKAELL